MGLQPTIIRTTLLTLLVIGAPRIALACPVCFGQNDSPLGRAMNTGIGLMLVVVVGVMAAFASFFVSLARRARQAEVLDVARAQSEPQEGTAQC
jgi:hypothetical protein